MEEILRHCAFQMNSSSNETEKKNWIQFSSTNKSKWIEEEREQNSLDCEDEEEETG